MTVKEWIRKDMERGAAELQKAVESEPDLQDVKCPDTVGEKLFARIRASEESKNVRIVCCALED